MVWHGRLYHKTVFTAICSRCIAVISLRTLKKAAMGKRKGKENKILNPARLRGYPIRPNYKVSPHLPDAN